MVPVMGSLLCIDAYEASVGLGCPILTPESVRDTADNIVNNECFSESKSAAKPWRYVTQNQAMQICAVRGARLPTSEEWYSAALGTRDSKSCVLYGTTDAATTGSAPLCVSGSGAYDMIGNVWEYVADEVVFGKVHDEPLPESGYVHAISVAGTPTETSLSPSVEFNSDYMWVDTEGRRAIVRGGFYGSGDDGGLFSMQASIATDFSSQGIGFRCVKERI
jgi:formylglycine-generating enzyme required for sulfatase activity